MTAELDRRLRVIDTVMRHLIVRVDEELAVAERCEDRRKASMVARRAAPRAAARADRERGARGGREHEEDDMDSGPDMGFRGDRDAMSERGDR